MRSLQRALRPVFVLVVLSVVPPVFPDFLYVTTLNTVSGFKINPTTGVLSRLQGSPFGGPACGPSSDIAVDSSSRFVYIASSNGSNYCSTLQGDLIDFTTGALTPIGSPFATGIDPGNIAADPAGNFVYVPSLYSGDIWGYVVDRATGTLTPIPGSPFPAAPTYLSGLVVDPSGRFVYGTALQVTGAPPVGIWGFTANAQTGALTPMPGSPFPGSEGDSLVVDATGQFLYVTNESADKILEYSIDQITGALVSIPGSPITPNDAFPCSLAAHPSGRFLYVLSCSGTLAAYTIAASSGTLAYVPGSSQVTGLVHDARSLALDPTGKFAYVTNYYDHTIAGFTTDSATGLLTPIAGSPFAVSDLFPRSIAITRILHPSLSVSVTPNSGSDASQTFAFQYSDSNSFRSLTIVYAGFGPAAYVDAHTCRTEYYRAQNKLFLKNDAGTEWLGPVTLGVSGIISNSQCTVDTGASSVSGSGGSGDVLTLNLALSFTSAFAGKQGISMYAIDAPGVTTPGRQKVGTWNVP